MPPGRAPRAAPGKTPCGSSGRPCRHRTRRTGTFPSRRWPGPRAPSWATAAPARPPARAERLAVAVSTAVKQLTQVARAPHAPRRAPAPAACRPPAAPQRSPSLRFLLRRRKRERWRAHTTSAHASATHRRGRPPTHGWRDASDAAVCEERPGGGGGGICGMGHRRRRHRRAPRAVISIAGRQRCPAVAPQAHAPIQRQNRRGQRGIDAPLHGGSTARVPQARFIGERARWPRRQHRGRPRKSHREKNERRTG